MNVHFPSPVSYLDARLRLRRKAAPSGTDLLPRDRRRLPQLIAIQTVTDPIPDQRGRAASKIVVLAADVEIIAIRRSLYAFARLRRVDPFSNQLRQLRLAVAIGFKMDVTLLFSRCRYRGLARVRQIAMMLAHSVTGSARNEIARRFDRDHSTVWFAERKFSHLVIGLCSPISMPEVE